MRFWDYRRFSAPCLIITFLISFSVLFNIYDRPPENRILSGSDYDDKEEKLAEEFVENFEGVDADTYTDTTPPLILGSRTVYAEVGSDNTPKPYICMDDADKTVNVSLSGSYDLNTVGTYELEHVATDSAGNTARYPFTLKVVEELAGGSESQTTANTLPFADAVSRYKTEETSVGIDVSKWQGEIDWQKVADSGVEFAMIRMGFQKGFGGESELDEYFVRNFQEAQRVGIKVGLYYYTYSVSVEESVRQAFFILHTLNMLGFEPDMPIAYDWESWSKLTSLRLSINEFNDCAKIFLDIMDEVGYGGYLYSSKYYLESTIWRLPDEYPVWLAHYTSDTSYEGSFKMWQCSCTGRVPGIDGDVDINVLYK